LPQLFWFWSSTIGILLTLSALHEVCRYRMQFDLKGIALHFEIALKAISDPFARWWKVFNYRMQYCFIFADFFDFAHAVAIPVFNVQKAIWYLLKLKQKGHVTLSSNVTYNDFMCLLMCYMKNFFNFMNLSTNRRKLP
jgi:hypothetical protein